MTKTYISPGESFLFSSLFGDEWASLAPEEKGAIIRDCTEHPAVNDYNSYAKSIGKGNLKMYSQVMLSQFSKLKSSAKR